MNKKEFKNLLSRFLKRQTDDREEKLIDHWYKGLAENEPAKIPGLENPKSEYWLQEEIYAGIQKKLNINNRPERNIQWIVSGIAASFIVVIGLSFLFLNNRNAQQVYSGIQVYSTLSKELKKIILPDSSVVYMNADSRISFPTTFAKNQRNFKLEEGEAYFQIKRDVHRPFVIQVQQLKVRVLGTTFNINAYNSRSEIKVNVTSGKVRVSRQQNILGELTKNQQITYRKKDLSYFISPTSEIISKGWIAGKTSLSDASFEELAQAVSNVYGVRLRSTARDMDQYRYNITIRSDKTLDQILDLICKLHHNRYQIQNKEVLIY